MKGNNYIKICYQFLITAFKLNQRYGVTVQITTMKGMSCKKLPEINFYAKNVFFDTRLIFLHKTVLVWGENYCVLHIVLWTCLFKNDMCVHKCCESLFCPYFYTYSKYDSLTSINPPFCWSEEGSWKNQLTIKNKGILHNPNCKVNRSKRKNGKNRQTMYWG